MILFPEKFNIKDMVKGVVNEELVKNMKPENLKPGVFNVDSSKSELERYLFMNMMEGEEKNDRIVSKTVDGAHLENQRGRLRACCRQEDYLRPAQRDQAI